MIILVAWKTHYKGAMNWYGKVWMLSMKIKTYYDRSTCGPQNEIADLIMVFNPTISNGQTSKIKSFYSGTQIMRGTINDLTLLLTRWKQKKQQKVHYNRLKNFNRRNAPIDEKEPKKAKSEPR